MAIISVLGAGYEANIYADNYFDQVHQGKKFDWGEYTGGLWNAAKHGVAIALGSIICVVVASIFTLSVVSWVLLGLIMLAIGGILLVAADIMSFKNNPLGAEIAQLLAELSFATGGAFLGAAGSAAGGASAAEDGTANGGSGLSKSEILEQNRIAGAAAEEIAEQQLLDEGYTIIGRQVSVRTSAGRRVIDLLVSDPAGNMIAFEVKSGNAIRSSTQLTKDMLIETEGGILIGKNAGDLSGQFIQVATEEKRIPRLII